MMKKNSRLFVKLYLLIIAFLISLFVIGILEIQVALKLIEYPLYFKILSLISIITILVYVKYIYIENIIYLQIIKNLY